MDTKAIRDYYHAFGRQIWKKEDWQGRIKEAHGRTGKRGRDRREDGQNWFVYLNALEIITIWKGPVGVFVVSLRGGEHSRGRKALWRLDKNNSGVDRESPE